MKMLHSDEEKEVEQYHWYIYDDYYLFTRSLKSNIHFSCRKLLGLPRT